MNSTGQRVLIISSRPVLANNDEPHTRCWQLAVALAQTQDIILAVPEVTALSHPLFAVIYYNRRNVGLLAKDSDVVILDCAVLKEYPSLVDAGAPVAVDLAGVACRSQPGGSPGAGIEDVLSTADFFFCPDEESRTLWLQALMRAGRVNPYTAKLDSGLRHLIDVVTVPPIAGLPHASTLIKPLERFCSSPRFAADRGTEYNQAKPPALDKSRSGFSYYLHRLRHYLKTRSMWRAPARNRGLIKRKFSGERKN